MGAFAVLQVSGRFFLVGAGGLGNSSVAVQLVSVFLFASMCYHCVADSSYLCYSMDVRFQNGVIPLS